MAKTCFYCEEKFRTTATVQPFTERIKISHSTKTRDHIIPISRGGLNVPANIVACCYSCNQLKGNYLLEEWLPLITNPIIRKNVNLLIGRIKMQKMYISRELKSNPAPQKTTFPIHDLLLKLSRKDRTQPNQRDYEHSNRFDRLWRTFRDRPCRSTRALCRHACGSGHSCVSLRSPSRAWRTIL